MTEDKNLYFLNLAIEEAEKALLCNEVPVGCIVVKNEQILYKSHNYTNFLSDPLAHAEFLCVEYLLKNNYNLDDLIFYITIEPCVMCHGVLERINAKVFYGYENEIFGTKKILNKSAGILIKNEKCVDLLKKFYESDNPALINKEK